MNPQQLNMLSQFNWKGARRVLNALQGGYRFEILLALAHSRQCVTSLATAVDVSPSTISQNLRAMGSSELVCAHRQGQRVEYRLTDAVHVSVEEVQANLIIGDDATGVIAITAAKLEAPEVLPLVTVAPPVPPIGENVNAIQLPPASAADAAI